MKENPGKKYLRILLPITLSQEFTYSIPQGVRNKFSPGELVVCPFGKSKKYLGVILGYAKENSIDQEIREIEGHFSRDIKIPTSTLDFWSWLSNYYMVAKGSILELAMGGIVPLKNKERFRRTNKADEFFGQKSSFLPDWLDLELEWTPRKIKGLAEPSFIRKLVKSGYLEKSSNLEDDFIPFTKEVIAISPLILKSEGRIEKTLDSLNKAKAQKKAFELILENHYENEKNLPVSYLRENGINRSVLKQLEIKGIIRFEKEIISRIKESHIEKKGLRERKEEQPKILGPIEDAFYEILDLIKSAQETGQQVLVICPEDNQAIGFADLLLQNEFRNFNLYTRATTRNERREILQACSQGKLGPLIGGPISSLLPFKKLDCIIILNEHNTLYKRQKAGNINFKDLTQKLANHHGAQLILQSPTPTLETGLQIRKGLVKETAFDPKLPELVFINKREHTKKNLMRSGYSKLILDEISQTISKGGQVMVLQNRKGYASYIECEECQHIPKCPNCDVSLTYFKSSDELKCRYCGENYPNSPTCPNGHNSYKTVGGGTEKAEEDLKLLFPDLRILRIDSEAIKGKRILEKLKRDFEQTRVDIMITTQFSFFKFNFSNLRLAVIPNFDQYLNLPDFRNHEHAFQALADVSGFFEPNIKPRLLIQTSSHSKSFLAKIQNWDYKGFSQEELSEREEFKYPPYFRLLRISTFAPNNLSGLKYLNSLTNNLSDSIPPDQLLGPFEPPVKRIRNEYIHQLLIKEVPNQSILASLKRRILAFEKGAASELKNSVRIEYDVDPVN